MLNSLIEKLKEVKDFRKSQGRRHELWVVLTIIILALLTGNVSYKPEMLNVVTKLYIFKYSSIIKGKNVNIS